MNDLEFHPLADEYDLAEGEDFGELCASIKECGLDGDGVIVVYEGKILDGRNRYRACKAIGVEPRFRQYDPVRDGQDAAEYVRRRNDPRRHDPLIIRKQRRKARMDRIKGRRESGESLRSIAEAEYVTESQVRRDLEESTAPGGGAVEPQDGKVKGKDGRTRTAKPKRPAKKPPKTSTVPEGGTVEREPGEDDGDFDNELFDEAEQPLPLQAYGAFNQLPEIRQLVQLCDQLSKEVKRVGSLPVGRCMLTGTILSQIKAVRQNINGSKPCYVCPYCRGKKSDCKACVGTGWVTAHTWKQAPPEMRKIQRHSSEEGIA